MTMNLARDWRKRFVINSRGELPDPFTADDVVRLLRRQLGDRVPYTCRFTMTVVLNRMVREEAPPLRLVGRDLIRQGRPNLYRWSEPS